MNLPRICTKHFQHVLRQTFRHLLSACEGDPCICIVGSGPAGFYTAQQILKGHPSAKVDIIEKLPVPFGLVRYGVAPDHPEVKNVINTFTQTARNERCRFMGNVEVGKDISIADLRKAYTAVVLSYGADDDRTLGIKGEDNPSVLSARSFVGWFNSLPQDRNLKVDLDMENVVILGQGNVALDVARILLTPVSILKKTDISQHALEALSKSKVKKVYLVGRRGPLQVAFTIKELRELVKLPSCRPIIHKRDVAELKDIIKELPRPRQRLTQLLHQTAMETNVSKGEKNEVLREWELRFRLSPIEILEKDGKLKGVQFCVNELQGEDLVNKSAIATQDREEIQCGLVFRSIGYRSVSIDSCIPFNDDKGIILNDSGRVHQQEGLYCSGWVSNGPVGVILTTMTDGFETGKLILKDIADGKITSFNKPGSSLVTEMLNTQGKQIVSFEDWDKIDKEEIRLGTAIGKPREKIVDTIHMLQIASSESKV